MNIEYPLIMLTFSITGYHSSMYIIFTNNFIKCYQFLFHRFPMSGTANIVAFVWIPSHLSPVWYICTYKHALKLQGNLLLVLVWIAWGLLDTWHSMVKLWVIVYVTCVVSGTSILVPISFTRWQTKLKEDVSVILRSIMSCPDLSQMLWCL